MIPFELSTSTGQGGRPHSEKQRPISLGFEREEIHDAS